MGLVAPQDSLSMCVRANPMADKEAATCCCKLASLASLRNTDSDKAILTSWLMDGGLINLQFSEVGYLLPNCLQASSSNPEASTCDHRSAIFGCIGFTNKVGDVAASPRIDKISFSRTAGIGGSEGAKKKKTTPVISILR